MIYFLLYMLTGVIAGTLSGLLGIGGGIIVIPSLVWIFKAQGFSNALIMHMAAGTSLCVMVLTASSSLYGHLRRGVEIWSIYKRLVVGIIIGTIVGAIFGHFLHSNFLQILFAIFVLIMSFRMILALKSNPSRTLPSSKPLYAIAFAIGAKSGLLGIGGGAIIIPFLNYCNVATRKVVATSVACSVTIAFIGTISFMIIGSYFPNLPAFTTGYVYWPAVLGVAITGPICAQLGAYLSHQVPVATLKRILGVLLLIIAVKMLLYY